MDFEDDVGINTSVDGSLFFIKRFLRYGKIKCAGGCWPASAAILSDSTRSSWNACLKRSDNPSDRDRILIGGRRSLSG